MPQRDAVHVAGSGARGAGGMNAVRPHSKLGGRTPAEAAKQVGEHVRITSLIKVKGRSNLTGNERFARDPLYVDIQSFRLDSKIFFLMVCKVISCRGGIQEGGRSMPLFTQEKRE